MRVYAWDCDGTLSSGQGPVGLDALILLASRGDVHVMVSPSGNCGSLTLAHVNEGDRTDCLRRAKALFPGAEEYVYVSDNPGDDLRAADAGFRFVHSNRWDLHAELAR
jgi:hypothetical protein